MSEPAQDLTASGPLLTLRYPRAADAPRLFELASDPEVTYPFSWGPYEKQAEAAEWIASLPRNRVEGVALEFAIVDPADRPVGIISLLEVSLRDRRGVIGIWLGREFWGSGVGDEAEALLARIAFESLRIERLGAWVDVANHRSQRAFERLGFIKEGILRSFQRHYDKPHDLVSYSLLREEWADSEMAAIAIELTGEAPVAFVCAPR
ncbi:MAG TPA: GNAT family N-acetyltransferase [Solirubrobacteraceae bacterium]|nr:GNAT family N-acetyltransferase [Solirubrobacteraceae bacterium]